MKKMILTVLILLLSLAACRPESVPETRPPEPGYFVLSSIGNGTDITFLSEIDPANGYVRLDADHTGVMRWEETEQDLTWDNEAIYWGGKTIPCMFVTSYSQENKMEAALLLLVFEDSGITAIFRPVEQPPAN